MHKWNFFLKKSTLFGKKLVTLPPNYKKIYKETFYKMGQLQERYKNYREPQKFMEAGVYPFFREISGKQGTEVVMEGHNVLMFGSNAYTGLTGDQRIIDAAKAALDKYGTGCAGSRFLNGTLDLHVQLEKELSEFIGKDDALGFSTGFSVNAGVIAMVVGRNDYVICDDRDHASIVDGRRLSFARQLQLACKRQATAIDDTGMITVVADDIVVASYNHGNDTCIDREAC